MAFFQQFIDHNTFERKITRMEQKIFLYILIKLTLILVFLNIRSRKTKQKNKKKKPIISDKIAQAMASKIKFESEQHRKKK